MQHELADTSVLNNHKAHQKKHCDETNEKQCKNNISKNKENSLKGSKGTANDCLTVHKPVSRERIFERYKVIFSLSLCYICSFLLYLPIYFPRSSFLFHLLEHY